MDILLTAIAAWLTAAFGLPAAADLPRIERLPPARIAEIRYGAASAGALPDVVAVYRDADRTIVLRDDWIGATPAEVSVLVHEMVHHLQNSAGLASNCAAEREELAYAAQEAWLGLFDQDLEGAFGIGPAEVKLATHCLQY